MDMKLAEVKYDSYLDCQPPRVALTGRTKPVGIVELFSIQKQYFAYDNTFKQTIQVGFGWKLLDDPFSQGLKKFPRA